MENRIFLIGPGGAGKSTTGAILSGLLGYKLIDLDTEFCERVRNIRDYIKCYGYERYLEQNSLLLWELLSEYENDNSLFVLSSGFLSTDIRQDIVEKNKKIISENGLSLLLMPSRNYSDALECILSRQLNRGFGLTREQEMEKFSHRFYEYMQMGDLQFFLMAAPETIAQEIACEITSKFEN